MFVGEVGRCRLQLDFEEAYYMQKNGGRKLFGNSLRYPKDGNHVGILDTLLQVGGKPHED